MGFSWFSKQNCTQVIGKSYTGLLSHARTGYRTCGNLGSVTLLKDLWRYSLQLMHLVHTYRSRCKKLCSDRSEPNSERGSLRIAGSTLSVVELSLMGLVKLNRILGTEKIARLVQEISHGRGRNKKNGADTIPFFNSASDQLSPVDGLLIGFC